MRMIVAANMAGTSYTRRKFRIRAIRRQNHGNELARVSQREMRPQQADNNEERTVRHALQVADQPHPRVLRRRERESGAKTEEKEHQAQHEPSRQHDPIPEKESVLNWLIAHA